MKRLICILLIFILGTFGTSVYSEEFYTDDVFETYRQRTELCKALGILKDSDVKDLSEEVSVRCFVEITARAIGMEVPETDKKDEWHIRTAQSLSIFSADEPADLERMTKQAEAIRVFAGVLGYDEAVKAKGYVSVASDIGLLKGINASERYLLTYNAFMQLLDNAMEAKVMVRSYGTNGSTKTGGKWLWERFEVVKKSGVVTANNYSDLIKDTQTASGHIEIDRVDYSVYKDFPDFLGYSVVYYVNTDDEIIYLHKDSKNEVTTIKADDIVSYNNRIYRYDDNGKQKSKSLPSDCYIIYNMRTVSKPTQAMFTPEEGYIEIIDNNDDGAADVLKITSYEVIEIYNIDYDNYLIYGEKDAKVPYNLENAIDGKRCIISDADGQKAEFNLLKKGDVIAVYVSGNSEAVKIDCIAKYVNGNVTALNTGDGDTLSIGDTEYKASDKIFESDNVALNKKLKFYLYDDKIVYAKSLTASGKIGYLIETAIKENSKDVFKGTMQMRILDEEGNVGIFDLTDNAKIDNIKVKTAEQGMSLLKKENGDTAQVIEYSVNADGKVYELNTPYNNKGANDAETVIAAKPKNNESADSLRLIYPEALLRHQHMQKTFSGKFNYTNNTTIFRVPTEISDEDDDYSVTSYGFFSGWADYTVEAYSNTPGSLVADAMVVKLDVNNDPQEYGVISDITRELNEKGDPIICLNVISKSGKSVYWTEYEDYVAGVEKGDIIRFLSNVKSKLVKKVTVMFDASDKKLLSDINPTVDANLCAYGRRIIFGYVYEYDSGVASISTVNPAEYQIIPDSKIENHNIEAYKYCLTADSSKKETVKNASADEIKDYKHVGSECSVIALYTLDGSPGFCVIYK